MFSSAKGMFLHPNGLSPTHSTPLSAHLYYYYITSLYVISPFSWLCGISNPTIKSSLIPCVIVLSFSFRLYWHFVSLKSMAMITTDNQGYPQQADNSRFARAKRWWLLTIYWGEETRQRRVQSQGLWDSRQALQHDDRALSPRGSRLFKPRHGLSEAEEVPGSGGRLHESSVRRSSAHQISVSSRISPEGSGCGVIGLGWCEGVSKARPQK